MPAKDKAPSGGSEKKHPLVDDREPIAPDGGWGWVILLASFLTSVIVDGVCFAFGIFLLEFLRYFGESKGKTAWIGSVLNGTYMVMGPLVGALANRFGCRAVAIAGSLWSAVAFFISTFATNVDILILTYGVLGGIGFGLMYLPSIVIVGFYFDKKRAFATGIATCGSGIGAFIMAPLCKFLIDCYGWRGAQWIVAAIVLNGVVLGALYRPLTFNDMEKMRRKWRRKQMQKLQVLIFRRQHIRAIDQLAIKSPIALEHNPSSHVFYLQNIITNDTTDTDSEETEITGVTDTTDNYRIQIDPPSQNYQCNNNKQQPNGNTKDQRCLLKPIQEAAQDSRQNGIRRRTVSNQSENDFDVQRRHLGDSWHSLSGFACSMENIAHEPTRVELSGEIHQQRQTVNRLCDMPKEILATVAKTMDFTMLKNPVFVLYGFSCILCMAGFFIPFIYLPDNAIGLGYSSGQAAMLLSVLGITNTLGRVIAGWVSDRPWADCLLINNLALIIGGVATILCPFFKSYAALVVYSCVFGMCIAAFVSLRSIILVDLIGLNKLTSAFGIIVLCQGLTSFVGAPIAGWMYDVTGSFNVSFYVAGTTIALAGIICLPLRRVAKWYNNYKGKYMLKEKGKIKDSKEDLSKKKSAKSNEKNEKLKAESRTSTV